MEQLLTRDPLQQPQDREGSLVDPDMGAYYICINQSRLVVQCSLVFWSGLRAIE
jgi:hypothetical protein